MSTREMINALLDSVPEYKMGYVLAYLQGLTAIFGLKEFTFPGAWDII